MLKDFKEFAFKGNLIDMAVGIIIGGAFATVVKSLVEDIFMPIIGKFTGGANFTDLYVPLSEGIKEGTPLVAVREAGGNALAWGNFVTQIISFLILALVIFIVIKKVVGAVQKEPEPEPDPEPSDEVKLLTEIRDSLAK